MGRLGSPSPPFSVKPPCPSCLRVEDVGAVQGMTILPPVDLLVRTGGERRLSDFLLWECAYAELLFLDVLWPDITSAHLDDAIADYASRDRRFGSIPHRASA